MPDRTRQGFIEERTATYNRPRGLIAEFGIVLPLKVGCLRHGIGAHLEARPGYANRCIGDLLAHADQLDARIADYDPAISLPRAKTWLVAAWIGLTPVSTAAWAVPGWVASPKRAILTREVSLSWALRPPQ